ncbi:putative Phosphate regulon transcriptional regulatory protein PhoB [Candidatus Terasakiella magnetica]|uniref:Putative Phosphate regulon transcriptional regulatory protein PhoB n=1 Tax=Candidatus Terasakiella magnetica TaxID=1867952 RepID=A0A1C3RFC3_9PROT|nr:response regulator transcription factor [Candidatus Terasakiella magnetica]SCA55993.1 putative Phosphate regulon transcriptional regulatory protein PhoB [Candidatus Terasakiella magnetica]
MKKIDLILVDDDDDFRSSISDLLELDNFNVRRCASLAQMWNELETKQPDLLVLDVLLPDGNGFEALAKIKKSYPFPVVMLTILGETQERIEGLSEGADYYLSKPVDYRELSLVLKNLLRRYEDLPQDKEPQWQYNPAQWHLFTPKGDVIELTAAENKVINHLVRNKEQTVSRDDLYLELGRTNTETHLRSLDLLISRIRKKILVSSKDIPFKAVRGVGYMFTAQVTVHEES